MTSHGAVMTDGLGNSDLSSPTTDCVSGGSASALSVHSNGITAAFAGGDDKELSTVAKRFLIVEINRLVEENQQLKVDKRLLVAEINRLVEENQQLKQFKEKYHDLDKKLVVLEKYHDLDKKLAVLKETIKPFRRNLFLSSVCLIAGAAGVAAAAPSILSINQYGWYVFVSFSTMLLIAGIAARVEKPASK
jgi:FtsZ-binding cell division protein ZapB